MRFKKYSIILILIILLAVLSVYLGVFEALVVGNLLYITHGLFMWKSNRYKRFFYSTLGTPLEFKFDDREKFYMEQGVDVNSKPNKIFNSEVFIGIIILVQTLLHFDDFSYRLSIMNAILYGVVIFIAIVLLDNLLEFIARKSKDYTDYYMKFICALIFITIPFMFFGMIWIFVKK